MYSLWLEPPASSAVLSGGFIKKYADASGGRCPVFDPHITLAGGFVGTDDQARERSKTNVSRLAATVGALRREAIEMSTGTRIHQCVYLRYVPDARLNEAHVMAANAFGVEPGNGGGAPYVPHLSLVYGDLTEAERLAAREDARGTLGGDVSREEGLKSTMSFVADSVSLWRTDVEDPTCASWSRVERYPLSGGERDE